MGRDTAKGRDTQNRRKDPGPVFWKLPDHREQEEWCGEETLERTGQCSHRWM